MFKIGDRRHTTPTLEELDKNLEKFRTRQKFSLLSLFSLLHDSTNLHMRLWPNFKSHGEGIILWNEDFSIVHYIRVGSFYLFLTWLMRIMPMSSLTRKPLKHSSMSPTLVFLSTTRKFGHRALFISPMPPSRNPVHVSSSPITDSLIETERWGSWSKRDTYPKASRFIPQSQH